MKGKILVINPGSTSTKIAMYSDGGQLWSESIEHTPEEIRKVGDAYAQIGWRSGLVVDTAKARGESLTDLAAVVSRGGPFAPVRSGAYEVNAAMLHVMRTRPQNKHVAIIGMEIARRIAGPLGVKAYIYDAVTVDEMIPLVRIVGLKEMERRGQGHNLNMRAAAIKYSKDNGLDYHKLNILVCHMGGGITLSLHSRGLIIDMISDDEGPFSPERAGGLPGFQLVRMCCDEGVDYKEMMRRYQRDGGLMSLLGTTDARAVEKMIGEGDERARLVYEAMALSIAKNLAKLSVVVNGKIDAIVLTGGIAYSKMLTGWVRERVEFIAPVYILPGENEMDALAFGVYRVLDGEEKVNIFADEKKGSA